MDPDVILQTEVLMATNDSIQTHLKPTSPNNGTEEESYFDPFSLQYRVVATVAYSVIFILGITGNSIVIFTIYVSRSLHTSAYAYLTSLACADLLVVCTSIPEGIVYTLSSGFWYSTSAVCSFFVFINFFLINVGTLSMMAFTVERYIATCRPFLAQTLNTLERSRKIVAGCWVVAVLYGAPWLALTDAIPDEYFPELKHCRLTLSQSQYTTLFAADLILFYVVPLIGGVFVYWNIGQVLQSLPDKPGHVNTLPRGSEMELSMRTRFAHNRKYAQKMRNTPAQPLPYSEPFADSDFGTVLLASASRNIIASLTIRSDSASSTVAQHGKPSARRNVAQSLRILMATVLLFAICWLPFRGLLVYNSIANEPWLDLWYTLFSKCMIFFNCCVNPLLYTLLSKRFRECVKKALTFKKLASLSLRL